jgi:hypothetical protein
MDSTNALVRMADQPALDRVARPLSEAIRGAYSRAGDAGQVDVPIGAWTIGARARYGRVCALAHSCSHLGGPLSDGTLKDGSVERQGKIEVRARA